MARLRGVIRIHIMRRSVLAAALLVLGLLPVGGAEAKRREPPTRSQALASCGTPACLQVIEQGEAAFLAGRWHPSEGPFRTGTNGGYWADCSDTTTGTSFGSRYFIPCSYLSNIDKDPEFPVFVREREAAKQRKEAERQKRLAEKGRHRKATTVASLEQALSGTAAIPASASELRTAIAKDRVNPYERVNEQLAAAEQILQDNQLTLRDVTPEYEARIRALRERNTALGEQFALQESESLRKLTAAKLHRYSLSQLATQTRMCEAVRTVAGDSLATLSPDSERRNPLGVARERARKCLAACEEATSRAEEIYALQIILCVDYPKALQALAERERRKNEIDRASGTRDLAEDRALAELRISLREERNAAIRRLKQLGAPYSKSRCSKLE